jgi:hypothetical protein
MMRGRTDHNPTTTVPLWLPRLLLAAPIPRDAGGRFSVI